MSNNKKKILIIPSWYPTLKNPTAGIFFQEQALLVEDIFDIKVLVANPCETSLSAFWKAKLQNKVLNLPQIDLEIYEINQPPAYKVAYPVSKATTKKNNFYQQFPYFKATLQTLIEKYDWKPDLIHAQSTNSGGIIAHYLSQDFNIPYLITEHFNRFFIHRFPLYEQEQILKSLKNAHNIAAVSQYQARILLMHVLELRPIVVGNLVDENRFHLTERNVSRNENNKFTILTTAMETIIKDLFTLFDALSIMKKSGFTDFKVLIVGNGTGADLPKGTYKNYAQNLGLEQECVFIDSANRDELANLYQECDVFVSTSLAETFGVACCEALFSGKPVIATSNGGIDDMLTAENGIKVDIRDSAALAKAILAIRNKEIVFDPQTIRNSVIDKFGTKAFHKKITNLYNQTIEKYQQK
jgi:glycosyltransferase involved in cell wall biosynthesis